MYVCYCCHARLRAVIYCWCCAVKQICYSVLSCGINQFCTVMWNQSILYCHVESINSVLSCGINQFCTVMWNQSILYCHVESINWKCHLISCSVVSSVWSYGIGQQWICHLISYSVVSSVWSYGIGQQWICHLISCSVVSSVWNYEIDQQQKRQLISYSLVSSFWSYRTSQQWKCQLILLFFSFFLCLQRISRRPSENVCKWMTLGTFMKISTGECKSQSVWHT